MVEKELSISRALQDDQDEVEMFSQTDKAIKEFKYLWRRYGNWDNPRSLPIVARLGGVIVGMHAAAFGYHHVNSYYQLTDPRVRGQGVGGLMVSFLLSEAKALGVLRLKFKVPFDSDGQRFWEGFGLVPFAKDDHHWLFDVGIESVETAGELKAKHTSGVPSKVLERYLKSQRVVLL